MFSSKISPIVQKILLGFLLVLLLVGGWLLGQRKDELKDLRSLPDHSVIEWRLAGEPLRVEVVNTPASIEQGLSGRESLTTDGMLFVFAQPTTPVFWMKEMLFPIDIIWLSDGKIVGLERNVQPPELGVTTNQLEKFLAPQAIELVLETVPGKVSD